MRNLICDTSPLQYLHQLEHLDVLPKLAGSVVVPPAVVRELSEGKAAGHNVPSLDAIPWIDIRKPTAISAERLIGDLGPGETEVLMLALEEPDAVAVIDDKAARRIAETLRFRFTGTLGILLDAKRIGLIPRVSTPLRRLEELGFHLSSATHDLILREASESE